MNCDKDEVDKLAKTLRGNGLASSMMEAKEKAMNILGINKIINQSKRESDNDITMNDEPLKNLVNNHEDQSEKNMEIEENISEEKLEKENFEIEQPIIDESIKNPIQSEDLIGEKVIQKTVEEPEEIVINEKETQQNKEIEEQKILAEENNEEIQSEEKSKLSEEKSAEEDVDITEIFNYN